jgi:16S rRNA (cytosine1402-N4)-methyltransferase
MSINEHPPQHVPVLLDACIELLNPKSGEHYLDLTAGYGGHASVILERTEDYRNSCLVDRDEFAIAQLAPLQRAGVELRHQDFASASQQLVEEGRQFDIILVDLGVSSPQLDRAERGFSFTHDGPLDMRMDSRQTLDARQYVNTVRADELADVIHRYGEESLGTARRYAQAIVKGRPYETTRELADTIRDAHVGKWQKIHPATRTFQAIRIQINQELRQIEMMLPLLPKLLRSGGRVGIISFHSLEDRLVKRYFAEQDASGYEAELTVLTKKPRSGTEDVHNPRSRSAKLRVAVKK